MICTLDNESKVELRLALHRYLAINLPNDTEKLELMFLSFKMWRELAENLKAKADEKVRHLKTASVDEQSRELVGVIEWYLDAADSFVKDKCYHLANQCIAQANLAGLQIQEPELRLLNLTHQVCLI